MQQDTFSKYGFGFQTKLISQFINPDERDFAKQIVDSLDKKLFENQGLQWIVENSINYFNEYKLQPSLEVFKVQVSNIPEGSLLRTEVINCLREVFKNTNADDKEFIKKETVEFLRNRNIRIAYENGIDLIAKGDYESLVKSITEASNKVQLEHNLGHDYLTDVDYRYSDQGEVKRISTGWKVIDNLMQGGLPIGKLGFWMGDQGVGKSFSLVHLGAEALKLGYDVVHWTFELDENYVAYRYDAKLTGIALDDLKYNVSDVKKRLAKYPGRLIIKEFPASIVTMQDLMRHRDKLHSQGIRPKLFLNDYLDLMKLPKRKDARTDELLQLQYREFRGFAQESEAAAWSVSQSNKLNANKSIGVKEALAGAYAKGAEADFWGIIGRNNFDKLSNKAIFDIQKNRFGPDGMNFAAKFDTAHSLIEIYEEKSETGKKVKKEIISDSQMQLQYGAKQFELMANNQRKDVNLF